MKQVIKTGQSHQTKKPSGVGVPTAASSAKSSAAKLFLEPATEPAAENITSKSAVKQVIETGQSHQIPKKPFSVGVPSAASSAKSSPTKLFPEPATKPAAENITPTKSPCAILQ